MDRRTGPHSSTRRWPRPAPRAFSSIYQPSFSSGTRPDCGLYQLAPLPNGLLPHSYFRIARLLMEANELPVVRTADGGLWRRLHLLPWRVRLQEREMVRGLEDQIFEREASGILNSMVDGALRYLTEGLLPPETVVAARDGYRRTSNPFREWLDEFAAFDAEYICEQASLHTSYRDEMENQGIAPMECSVVLPRTERSSQLRSHPKRQGAATQGPAPAL